MSLPFDSFFQWIIISKLFLKLNCGGGAYSATPLHSTPR